MSVYGKRRAKCGEGWPDDQPALSLGGSEELHRDQNKTLTRRIKGVGEYFPLFLLAGVRPNSTSLTQDFKAHPTFAGIQIFTFHDRCVSPGLKRCVGLAGGWDAESDGWKK